MYSVEDLLISHGYKLPQHTPSSTPTPGPAAPSRQAPSPLPPSYEKHHDDSRPAHGTVNGYERDATGGPYVNSGGSRPPTAGRGADVNIEARDRSQSRREGDSRNQSDTHSLGESLTSDSGFCDGPRGQYAHSKDVSYWRRRGQDFTVLLDYADFREPRGGGQAGYGRPEGPQQPRGQELSAEDRQREFHERQRWAAQARSREREAALHRWRMAAERKCQSLGNEEWRPAVSLGRQLSESEGERWAQEQQRLHARTPEGMVVHPRTKAKSQSLPRMQPDSLQYVDMSSSGQELYRRVNGHPLSPHDPFRVTRWPENGRPASATQLSMTPKPRFTRPPRPPSYEVHQQIRGSCEVLSGRDSAVPQARDRTPLPLSRAGDPQLDYFAQESGPPGYIPPPSYKRAPIMRGGHRGYAEIPINYRYRGDVYQQMQMAPDGSHWFSRHPVGSWPDPQREMAVLSRKKLYPGYTTQDRPGGSVQYIPFDDPRVRHISSALGGNSLTDADKIRHIRNELPSVTVSEPVSDDSAFLPPPLGPFIAAKTTRDANQTSSSDFDNDNNRWHSDLHKETVDNFPAIDQNCNNRYPKNQGPPPSPSSAFQTTVMTSSSSRQSSCSDQGYGETITQVKKIVPDSGPENNKNSKRRVSETIFCLVSVPIHTPVNTNKDSAADQNNNETMPSLTVTNADNSTAGHTESQSLRSKSMTEMPIKPHHTHIHTSSTVSMRNLKRAPLRKEIIDAWALQASEDKELCYAGSWPGDQYRNQETQTMSPVTVVKSPAPQSPSGGQESGQTASDTTTDSGVVTDSSAAYGYPMAGQKNLHPSSNSAFSRLSLSPTQPPSLCPSQPPTSSPSREERDQKTQQPSSPRKTDSKPPDGAEQVAFGQFLLKPVNRRPWDAIGELECFNKEMEDTISKRPNVEKSIEDLDEVHKNILELGKLGDPTQNTLYMTAAVNSDREAFSLPAMHINIPNDMKSNSESWGSTSDHDHGEPRSAFSRSPARTNTRSGKDELSKLPEPSPREYSIPPAHIDPNQVYRQDIPVPQESLLRDVGLTVYTETSGGPGEPIKRSLSVPSPLDHQELSWENIAALVENACSSEHNLNDESPSLVEAKRKTNADNLPQIRSEPNLNIYRTRSENSKNEGSPRTNRLTREAAFVFEDDEVIERYAISEPLSWKNESTIADKHLENLLIQEKANALPAEDLSNLYEVKCAKGIPENESIEQRAARILGIAVSVGALGVADGPEETWQEDADPSQQEVLEEPESSQTEQQENSDIKQQEEQENPDIRQEEELESTDIKQQEELENLDIRQEEELENTDISQQEEQENPDIIQQEVQENADVSQQEEQENADVSQQEEQENADISQQEEQENADISQQEEQENADISQQNNSDISKQEEQEIPDIIQQEEQENPDICQQEEQVEPEDMPSTNFTVSEVVEVLRETQQVTQLFEQVTEDSLASQGQLTEEGKEIGLSVDHNEGEDRPMSSPDHSECGNHHNEESQQAAVLDLPEFPPSTLPLSLPVTPDEGLTLSMCYGEQRKSRGGASRLIESIQDKLSSSASSSANSTGRSATERMARMKELDSVSRMRRLSLKSSDSGGEADQEETDGATEEKEAQGIVEGEANDQKEVEEEEEEEEQKGENDERMEPNEEESQEGCEVEEEREDVPEAELKIQEDEESEEIALRAEVAEEKEEEVELKIEEVEQAIDVELNIKEGDEEKPSMAEQVEEKTPEVELNRDEENHREAVQKEVPTPKERTRAQKPPLLPKPRSVAKREITLPLSFSSGSCGSMSLEEEEALSISDSYDPSRVERV